jgi:hypothetical protein
MAMIFPVVFKAAEFIFRLIVWFFKAIIEVLYFVVFWWWYAAIAKITHANVPPVNIWGSRDERRNE